MYSRPGESWFLYQETGEQPFDLVSGKDAVKAFVMAGGVVRQGKGDHVNIKMPNGQLITIPVSGDLKIGLLKSAIRKAGLDDEDFLKLLKGD